MSALEQAQRETSAAYAKIEKQLHGARINFWRNVSNEIASSIDPRVKEKIERIWASSLLGPGGTYEIMLATLFPIPDITRLKVVKEKLKGQYGLD